MPTAPFSDAGPWTETDEDPSSKVAVVLITTGTTDGSAVGLEDGEGGTGQSSEENTTHS